MKRIVFFLYGTFCYLFFLGIFLYAVGFLGNFGVPSTIDGQLQGSIWQALGINTLLLSQFALQHSVMARPWFKRWWTRYVPQPIERSTYVLFTNIALALLFYAWQPMGGQIWRVSDPIGQNLLYAMYAAGWGLVQMATLQINHFDLFGMRQVWLYLRNQEYTELPFKTPALYRHVRHPLYVGWFLAFWATPTMTVAHLVFALTTSIYILMAIQWGKKDLVDLHGKAYQEYRRQVPMLIPRILKKGLKGQEPQPVSSSAS
ncbi:MAG: isoprenylcysteine carboxylmethyltransferase family protein [Nitrospirota bacterium]|nr:isoprenylcysteine carboxylmethyltransferase family protein [Nitrospirota bacterium]